MYPSLFARLCVLCLHVSLCVLPQFCFELVFLIVRFVPSTRHQTQCRYISLSASFCVSSSSPFLGLPSFPLSLLPSIFSAPPAAPLPHLQILGAELAAVIAERDQASAAVSELQRRVSEQEDTVAGLREALQESRESTVTAVAAAETSAAESREVRHVLMCMCGCPMC